MALHLHHCERADGLADGLAELLAIPLADPFATEVIAVPARGMERWLMQRLSHRLGAVPAGGGSIGAVAGEAGICAGVRFPSPAGLLAELVLGDEDDPWAPDRAVWPLLAVIDEVADQPWCRALGRHLGVLPLQDAGGDSSGTDPDRMARRSRRYAVARRLAGIFDGYAADRPSMVADWAAGRDTDGCGGAVPGDLAWQPRLWRLLSERIPGPGPLDRMAAGPSLIGLPERVSLFGLTRIPAAQRSILISLAQRREVHLWLTQPTAVRWPHPGHHPAGAATAAVHPFLRSLGRESEELRRALLAEAPDATIEHHPAPEPTEALLGRLQADLRADRPPTPGSRPDLSVQLHACHGPARQVEVLRDVVTGLLADDPTLEPRDLLVMCPDIETFAPLLSAAFGATDQGASESGRLPGHPGHELRVRLADRSLQHTNPLFSVAATLLELAHSRITASQVLDLIGTPVVRRRFQIRDEDLELIGTWVAEAGIRWGLDASGRAPYQMQTVLENTWRAGLDRIVLGTAISQETLFADVLALPEVGSSEITVAGRLAEFLARLGDALASLGAPDGQRPAPVAEWLAALGRAVESLTDVPVTERWQQGQLRREFSAVLDEAAAGGRAASTPLRLRDVQALLAARLAGRPTRANFRTGTLTVCTMVPMRSVPHRVVCLLGLDDGVYPRRAFPDGDDVLARNPQPGERNPRAQDRQLLLDAVLAATDHLVITYSGADERTGARRPPAVPVGELLDVLKSMTGAGDDELVVRHPLQAFDPRNLELGALLPGRVLSYDPAALAGARAATQPRRPPAAFTDPLAEPPVRRRAGAPDADGATEPDAEVVTVGQLTELLSRPARGFLVQRLGLTLPWEQNAVDDAVPVDVGGLDRWRIADRMLRARLSGDPAGLARERELRRGEAPPGRVGEALLDGVLAEVEELVAGIAEFTEVPGRSVDVAVPMADGGLVRATISGLRDQTLLTCSYSRLRPEHRLAGWIALLALSAATGADGFTAVTVGRGSGRPMAARLAPVDPAAARRLLDQLVGVYRIGLQTPLPMAADISRLYTAVRAEGEPVTAALDAARRNWSREFGEGSKQENRMIWGGGGFDALLAHRPALLMNSLGNPVQLGAASDQEHLAGAFGPLSELIWRPLLHAERVTPL